MRLLFRGGAWLCAADAASIAAAGLQHLRAYRKLAELSLLAREPRFPVHCKFHLLHHVFRFLELASKKIDWAENPLTDSTQMCEGFIGHVARMSRRVSPQQTVGRTYDVYATELHRLIRDESADD